MSETICRTECRVRHHPQTGSDRTHRGELPISPQVQGGANGGGVVDRSKSMGYEGFRQHPDALKTHQDCPPELVDTKVGVVHVALGEHEVFTANTDGRPLPASRDREQAVRLDRITCWRWYNLKCKQGMLTFFIYRSNFSTSRNSKGASKSLKNLWRMQPPPMGPNAWLAGSGTSDSHFTAF